MILIIENSDMIINGINFYNQPIDLDIKQFEKKL